MVKKQNKALLLIFVGFFAASVFSRPASAVWAFLSDAYDKPLSFDSISTVRIMPPKIIEGDYQLFQNKPIDENTQGYQIASKAVQLVKDKGSSLSLTT